MSDGLFGKRYGLIMMNNGGFPTIIPSDDLDYLKELLTETYCQHYMIRDYIDDTTLALSDTGEEDE